MVDDERRRLRREVFALTWPMVLQNVFRTAMFYVDTIMLGHMGGEKAVEAVAVMGVCGPIVYTLVAVLTALSVGTIAIVSRSTGAGDRAKQEEGAINALFVGIVLGVITTVIGIFTLPWFTRFFEVKGSPHITAMASDYTLYYAAVLLFMILEIVSSAIYRAGGDSRTPMVIAIAGNLLNVLGNYLLIFGHGGLPAMGVQGAALSTAISYALEGGVMTLLLFTRFSPIRLSLASFLRVGSEPLKRFWRVSLPAVIEPVIIQSGFLVYMRIVNELGELSLTVHRVAIAVESASFMPMYGFTVACSALVGQSLGARKPEQAVQCVRETLRLIFYLVALLMAAYILLPEQLIWVFIPDNATVIGMGTICLLIAAIEQPFMALAMLYGGALRGAGDTRSPVLVAVVGVWLVRVPVSYLLAFPLGWGLNGIWWTMVIDWAARTLIFAVIYGKGKWKTIEV